MSTLLENVGWSYGKIVILLLSGSVASLASLSLVALEFILFHNFDHTAKERENIDKILNSIGIPTQVSENEKSPPNEVQIINHHIGGII